MKTPNYLNSILILFVVLFSASSFSQQKTGHIQGRILTADGSPAPFVNVIIKETEYMTLTDWQGQYQFNNIPFNTYTIEYNYMGYEKHQITVDLNQAQVKIDDIVLKESLEQLSEVIVVSQRLNQFAQKESEYVARVPLKNINNPQSYSVVTTALLNEQVNTDLPSAFKSITGGGYVESNDGNVSVYLRGFRSDVHIRNGGVAWLKTPLDPQNIERIEIIKGPGTIFYGANVNNIANYGGIVNKVTKQAYNGQKFDVNFVGGSWEKRRVAFDYNTVVDKNQKVYFRLNGAYNSENSFQDQGQSLDYMFAPSLTFNATDKLTIKANLEYNQSKRNLNFARGVSGSLISDDINSWDDLNWDYFTNYGTNEMAGYFRSMVTQVIADYQINQRWSSKTTFTSADSYTDANYLRVVMMNSNTVGVNYLQYDPRDAGNTHLQQDFIHVYEGDKLDNKLLLGVNYLNNYENYQRTGVWNSVGTVDTDNPVIYGLTNEQFEASIADQTKNQTISRFENLGFYAFDALTINEQLTVTAGARLDRYINHNTLQNGESLLNGYNQNAVSTKYGIAYNPFHDKLSVFANYMQGLTNNAPSDNGTGEIINWEAELAEQMEVGTKFNFFNGRLKSTISYYNVFIQNDIITNENGVSVQEGATRSTGIEADVIANPIPGLNLVAGYTYNDARLVTVNSGSESIIGNRLSYTPATIWNFWVSYQVPKGKVKGLGIGFGANHMSEIYNSTANTFGSDAYTTFDGTIFYNKNHYRISFKADNLTNLQYYNGYGIPQDPFNFRVGVSYKLF